MSYATDDDHEYDAFYFDDNEHAHYLGRTKPHDLPDLEHGQPVSVVFDDLVGCWYAVHTH